MNKILLGVISAVFVFALVLVQAQITTGVIGEGKRPALAVIDFRGASGAQPVMGVFNGTLFSDLQTSGIFNMVSKSLYPLQNPQRPEDLKPAGAQGLSLADWAGPPVSATHLAFGYTAGQNGQLVLYGWLYDVRASTSLQSAQVLGKRYFGTLDEAGARRVAHEFAADIIAQFGGGSLLGSRIYFVSNRTGSDEIWSMDYDGSNAKQLTFYKSTSITPSVSPDGSKIAFTTYAKGTPRIMIIDSQSGKPFQFYNQIASLNTTPNFTPDGKQIYYASSASGSAQIYVANLDGSNLRRVSHRSAMEVEPKVNPKNPNELVFVSGPGAQQIYKMNTDGADVERLTNGEGEASNPSWHPDGQHLLFAWTRGYATGGFNIFLMDAASRQFDQLTSNAGRNENPNWAPDGRHLVFMSTRSGSKQIWTMLADGSQLQRLTSQGSNRYPVWGK